eukprot:764955-Hanusia_phi.AAC.4
MAEKYKKHQLKTHILELPDTYIGSTEPHTIDTFLLNAETNKFEKRTITYIPGLYKIYDEIIVNAIDHSVRLAQSAETDIKPLKNIKVDIDRTTGTISVFNDGNGIDIVQHPEYNNIWVPSLIFGELLSSSNYNKDEEKLVGGKNGLGSKITNIMSVEFSVETVDHKTKKMFKQTWYDNMTREDKPSIKASSKQPYTKVTFTPDYKRFGMDGLDDDTFALFKKRVIDACACTSATVNVFFNEEKLNIKDFEKYVDLYLDTKENQPRIYEKCGDRWEIVAAISNTAMFDQISFVNGINTLRGGRHVDNIVSMITKTLSDMAKTKKKKDVKPQHIKDNLIVFVKCLIVNPSFDSQTKETLTTVVSKFGSKCELSDKFFDKMYKTGILDKAISLTDFHQEKKLTKTDGKKVNRVIVKNLDDAIKAGTADSAKCTLIICEGLSAHTGATAGLSVIGREYAGIWSVKGKCLNVKNATAKKMQENEELNNLKTILGLVTKKDYTDVSELRYGKILILTDKDLDGSHIQCLLMNIFQTLWPSLFKIKGFLMSLLSSIVKVKQRNGEEIAFYSMNDFEKWKQENPNAHYTSKYYKGIGTSTNDEMKAIFKTMKTLTYTYSDHSDPAFELAFNMKKADDRKEWLFNYDKNETLDYGKDTEVQYDEFIHKELKHFSNRDIERSIPHIADGLKESNRKILYSCLKKKLWGDNEIKVMNLASYTSDTTSYMHGETSLQGAIIIMAQKYVGANNIPLLEDLGMFGSRIMGGVDAASPRYIYTRMTELCRLIFREEDSKILQYNYDDGEQIEPTYFIGTIPLILINGSIGIATGFSVTMYNMSPLDVIRECKLVCNSMKEHNIDVKDSGDLLKAFDVINNTKFKRILPPFYLGFKGTIEEREAGRSYNSKGVWKKLDDVLVEVTELPVYVWTNDYKEFLESMLTAGKIKNFENHSTALNVKFIIQLNPDYDMSKFETEFKLTSSRNLSTSNMHLLSESGVIKKYNTIADIMAEWSSIRIAKYLERKNYQLDQLEKTRKVLDARVAFILDVINGKIKIMNEANKKIIEKLTELKYPKISGDDDEASGSYSYLLSMPISQLTLEKKEKLENELATVIKDIDALKNTAIYDIWLKELKEVEDAYIEFKEMVDKDYMNDLNGIVETKTKKKRTTKTKK